MHLYSTQCDAIFSIWVNARYLVRRARHQTVEHARACRGALWQVVPGWGAAQGVTWVTAQLPTAGWLFMVGRASRLQLGNTNTSTRLVRKTHTGRQNLYISEEDNIMIILSPYFFRYLGCRIQYSYVYGGPYYMYTHIVVLEYPGTVVPVYLVLII